MTTELIAAPKQDELDELLDVFPEYPPRGDMQNPIHIHEPSYMRALAIHFGRDETTLVLSEVPVSTTAYIGREHRRPDLIVAFDCDRDLLIRQKGYSIVRQGKPPDFALEVASESTGEVDYTDKRAEYAGYGISEYWRFDSSGGDYHDAPLAGDRLVEGKYERVDIIEEFDSELDLLIYRGYSEALGLWLYWEDGRLRWFNPVAGRFLRTHDEEYDRAELEAYEREQAEMRAMQAEILAEFEVYEREQAEMRALQAELRSEFEAQTRRQAETRAEQAEMRAEQTEAENRRLRAELEALQHGEQTDEDKRSNPDG